MKLNFARQHSLVAAALWLDCNIFSQEVSVWLVSVVLCAVPGMLEHLLSRLGLFLLELSYHQSPSTSHRYCMDHFVWYFHLLSFVENDLFVN